MKKRKSIDGMVQDLLSGDRRTAARLITMVENGIEENHEVMRRIYPQSGKAMILGVTGSGGAGKDEGAGRRDPAPNPLSVQACSEMKSIASLTVTIFSAASSGISQP